MRLISCLLICVFSFALSSLAASTYAEDKEDPPLSHIVTFDIQQGDEYFGKLQLGLFGSIVPKSVRNFVELSKNSAGSGYNHTIFHRVIKDFMVQGGDFEFFNGRGGYSIYGNTKFDDENFFVGFKKAGYLAYANSGPNSNGSQFFITTNIDEWLTGKHVIIGRVLNKESLKILDRIQNVETDSNDKPLTNVSIVDCTVTNLIVSEKSTSEYLEKIRPKPINQTSTVLFFLIFFTVGTVVAIKYRNYYYKNQLKRDLLYED
ncbi:uncharacterized protein ASCRUDRAFT_74085 [Ascoidea rubescens DSM 1968]|uniref:Peptidyl-prolyl cis-trans isomerase n=1 Tax=Ascoidea rubescens DSM 1968 TaxID=1344418 RepID=A0A1D2VS97_9ASCO|nr:hypothetical protein ASCRUDRAFT_74085 [Ascoidea rubescens DSM 1968]ODV64470.1 hypothetical protein ASCRUDRAFT_74085 [Ascoidea rubescens DSM 1968]